MKACRVMPSTSVCVYEGDSLEGNAAMTQAALAPGDAGTWGSLLSSSKQERLTEDRRADGEMFTG